MFLVCMDSSQFCNRPSKVIVPQECLKILCIPLSVITGPFPARDLSMSLHIRFWPCKKQRKSSKIGIKFGDSPGGKGWGLCSENFDCVEQLQISFVRELMTSFNPVRKQSRNNELSLQ